MLRFKLGCRVPCLARNASKNAGSNAADKRVQNAHERIDRFPGIRAHAPYRGWLPPRPRGERIIPSPYTRLRSSGHGVCYCIVRPMGRNEETAAMGNETNRFRRLIRE